MQNEPPVVLGHVGLTVSDLGASIAFYCDVVGFALEGRYEVAGEWFDTLTHNQGADIEVAMLRLGTFVLQLVAYRDGGGTGLDLAHHRAGSPHLSFTVADLDARHAALVAAGAQNPTPVVDVMGSAAIRSFYVDDPDGVPVEFLEMPT
jgi:catechol 2,3-dioxygenase-like lactoylglutathione lyase family enzyme